ncbi:unnamed protein product [Miscanthus lutarioriparius]|uniref:Uncharacterized protein n=1 Tax=Miscanthus lutarioriparius TaxID=422564 RepID=A0A811NEG5_9POAL|nr:unnamed protein product [Miscanthus lutarioriparius]
MAAEGGTAGGGSSWSGGSGRTVGDGPHRPAGAETEAKAVRAHRSDHGAIRRRLERPPRAPPLPRRRGVHGAAEQAPPRRVLEVASLNASEPPTTFFQVDRPIHPAARQRGALLHAAPLGHLRRHLRPPPVTVAYALPTCLGAGAGALALTVLEWAADCRGRQIDRIFGVWLSGAELLSICTAMSPGMAPWSERRVEVRGERPGGDELARHALRLAPPGQAVKKQPPFVSWEPGAGVL